jgi:hypothetical protein
MRVRSLDFAAVKIPSFHAAVASQRLINTQDNEGSLRFLGSLVDLFFDIDRDHR